MRCCHVYVLHLPVHHKHQGVSKMTSFYDAGNADQSLIQWESVRKVKDFTYLCNNNLTLLIQSRISESKI